MVEDLAMPDIAELTPSRLLLLFNAWENPGAYLLEIYLDVVVKGGSDAVVGLGFEVYVAEADRTPTTIEEDLAWAVSNDLIEVLAVSPSYDSFDVLPPNHLDRLFKKEGSDSLIPVRVGFQPTQQFAEFWRVAVLSFPLLNMSAGKTRLIRVRTDNGYYKAPVGLLRWVPEHPRLMERWRLRLWKTTPRKDLVWREGETAPYVRVSNVNARFLEISHPWETPDETKTLVRPESIEDSFMKRDPELARAPMFGHWIMDRTDILPWHRPGRAKPQSIGPDSEPNSPSPSDLT
jgi:hypothetical protein